MAINKIVPSQLKKPSAPGAGGASTTATAPTRDLSQVKLNLSPDLRMLLVGDTGAGKTTQIGELVEAQALETGQPAVMFRMDKGGNLPILPHIQAGMLEEYAYDSDIDPWIWISLAVRGEAFVEKKWVKVTKDKCLAVYEGLTAFAEALMMDLAKIGANTPAQAVGGESAWQLTAKHGDETVEIAGSTMSHYGLVQLRIMNEIWATNPGVPSIWTAILARSTDVTGAGGILGAMTTGKAQAAIVSRWYDYTFRLNSIPSETGEAKHILYLDTHLDKQARGVKVIANARMPLGGSEAAPVDMRFEPADLVAALRQLSLRQSTAADELKARFDKARGR